MIGFRFKEALSQPVRYYNRDEAWEDLPSAFFIDSDGDLLMITNEGWINIFLDQCDQDYPSYPVTPIPIEEIEFYKDH